METPSVEAPPASVLSIAQQRASLWADAEQRVYALVVASKIPGLRERLAQGGIDDWDGLWTGELDAEERAAAPLLITLRRTSAFTDWLLGAASSSFAGWGVLVPSRLNFLAMRKQGRALCRAVLPNGQAIGIDWMDPEVIEALLPVAPPEQLLVLFAGFDAIVVPGTERWVRWSARSGVLSRDVTGVA